MDTPWGSQLTPAGVRALVPAVGRFTWLNAAASSPLPSPVARARQELIAQAEAQGDLAFTAWLSDKERARGSIARFVGVRPEQLAFVPSTSFAFGAVARLLLREGVEEVLTLETEFPSTTLPLLHAGLRLRAVQRDHVGAFPVERLERALTPKTGAVALSVVQFASGFRVDLEGVAALCRAKGLRLVLNAAQGLGQVPVHFERWGVHALAAPSHKWLMGGYGTGVLALCDAWRQDVPALAGWLSVPPELLWQPFAGARVEPGDGAFTATGARFRHEASALEVGGATWDLYAGLAEAVALLGRVGVEAIEAHNAGLQQALRVGLRARGFLPNCPDERAAGICVVPVDGPPADAVARLVREANIVTTPRGGGLRISTHVFNTLDDVEALLAAVDRLGLRPG